jgi:hypothetical protein
MAKPKEVMMSETPERIWAFAPDIFDNLSVWQDAPSPAGDTIEYVRADRIEELEDKLVKAVEGFEKLARLGNGDRYGNSEGNVIAQIYIAELTGGKDE